MLTLPAHAVETLRVPARLVFWPAKRGVKNRRLAESRLAPVEDAQRRVVLVSHIGSGGLPEMFLAT